MKRYRVTFIQWKELEEFVEAGNDDEAEERAREQLESRDDPEPIDSGLELVGTEEDDD